MDNLEVQGHQEGHIQPFSHSQSVVAIHQGRAGPEVMHGLAGLVYQKRPATWGSLSL